MTVEEKDSSNRLSAGLGFRDDLGAGLKVRRSMFAWVLAILLLIYLLSGIYVVQPNEKGVVLRFGGIYGNNIPSGIHYRIPYPVDKCIKVRVTEIKRVGVGIALDGEKTTAAVEREVLTGDENVINIEVLVQFTISDPARYLFAVADPPSLIKRSTRTALTTITGGLGVDVILTTEKVSIQADLKSRIQAELNIYDCGVQILAVHLQSVKPPKAVSDAFMDVASAREDRARYINEAYGYSNDIIPQARGQERKILEDAAAYKTEVVSFATGETERFISVLAEYSGAEKITDLRLYLETMEVILPKMKKYIVDSKSEGNDVLLRYIEPVIQ